LISDQCQSSRPSISLAPSGSVPLFTTYFGWLFPSGKSITLLGEHGEQIIAAQRQLVRIGIDRLDAAAVGRISFLGSLSQLRGYHTATFDDLARNPDALVLDVRRDDERVNGYIRGSLHVPLHELPKKTSRLPDEPIWVHCASGYRAGIAASLLDRAGIEVVLINDTIESAHALLRHAVV
jgi:hydroxyacylglutathione hydrolase